MAFLIVGVHTTCHTASLFLYQHEPSGCCRIDLLYAFPLFVDRGRCGYDSELTRNTMNTIVMSEGITTPTKAS